LGLGIAITGRKECISASAQDTFLPSFASRILGIARDSFLPKFASRVLGMDRDSFLPSRRVRGFFLAVNMFMFMFMNMFMVIKKIR